MGTVSGLILIPVIFYTYNGAFGKSPDWFNIGIFFLSAALVYLYEARLFHARATPCEYPRLSLVCLLLIALLFVVFTFRAPELGIFRDPLSGTYAI